ncbi:MAG: hypothetical protein N2169_07925, partial [bacterium]|nr:hypothetical protein [bacterium]
MPDLRIFDGSKIEIYNTDNTNSGTINMIGSALKLQGQSSNILISSGNNLIFASNATIGGQNSILTLGNSGDTIALDNTGVTYRLGTINNHNDVLINSPSDGQLLYWSSGKIVNANNSQVAILNKEYPTLQIDHPTSGGNSGIVFNSRSNYGSDKAFILYQDNSTQVRSGGTEASRLIIGVYNDDSDNNSSDELWFEGCQRIVYNVGAYDSDIAGIIGTVASGTNATHEWRINDSKVASIDSTGFIVNKNLYVGYTASASNPEIVVGNGTSTGTSYLKFRTLGTEGWLQYGQGSNVFSFKNHSDGWANISANTFTSNVTTGTAPLTVVSNTLVSNLNADLLDGLHANVLGERYEMNIGNSDGQRRWARLATLDGINSTGGANLEFILSGTGDFGSAN